VHKVIVSVEEVKKIAKLASLKLQNNEVELFATQFTDTLDIVNELNEIDTSTVSGTYQVNNLVNISRDDIVDPSRVLPQEIALREAKLTHDGFFVVPRLIDSTETETVI